jgi:acyl-CoA synthetase (AMP-forming)/AMP-acid ligase II
VSLSLLSGFILFFPWAYLKCLFFQNAPSWVWFINEDGTNKELPKTASGKVMKHVLREWSKELAEQETGRVAP